MKPDDLEKELQDIVHDSSTLFGNVEEMTPEEVTAALVDTGASSDEVLKTMHSRLDTVVRNMRMKGETPPKRYLDALEQLRPATDIPKNPEMLQQHARKWISHLLRSTTTSGSSEVAFEFRNRDKLSGGDEKLLESAVTRVQKRIRDKQ